LSERDDCKANRLTARAIARFVKHGEYPQTYCGVQRAADETGRAPNSFPRVGRGAVLGFDQRESRRGFERPSAGTNL
jgi:hypothetical protein